jgi:hypothetical protein
MAALDGAVIRISACCQGLEIHLGVRSVQARHDDDCAALRPASPKFVAARAQANAAIAEALTQHGIPAMAAMIEPPIEWR